MRHAIRQLLIARFVIIIACIADAIGRGRAWRMPDSGMTIVLVVFVALMGMDGANALLYDPWSGISPVRRSSGQLQDIYTGVSRDLCVRR